ncbi:MAG: protein kinase [Myxococcales bacterium]|nr:protein kinase [Myxococcales bacterium]
MNTERWRGVEALFVRALELPESERARFVDDACPDDAEMQAELRGLLADAPAGGSLRDAIAAEIQLLASDAAAAKLGGRIGPFHLIKLLGQGGMGAVYLAERDDAQFAQRVAIKMLSFGVGSPEATARLRDERQILAALEHPNIVRLLDGGSTEDGLPYLVMEYIDGPSVTAYAQQHQLSVRARVELIRQVCGALQYAHQNLVVHRDIKPSNILVDASGAAKVLDFGIAKLLAPIASFELRARTRTGFPLFTPEYASPEQARGGGVSTVTDVYSTGAVLYELVTGQPPHRTSENAFETLRMICEVDPPRPSAVVPGARRRELAGDLDNIILKALQKDPARRYASTEQLADDLGRWLDGLPVSARTQTFVYRAAKFVRRNKGLVAAVAIVAGLQLRAMHDTRAARELAEARLTAGYVEQGRQALLDSKHAEAAAYLSAAWRRGGRSPAVAFMLARAVETLGPERLRLAEHDGTVWSAAFSPDGAQIATADDRSARLWDARTGALRFTLRHDDMVASAAFSTDGQRLVTASYDGTVGVWDPATGQRLRTLTGRSEDGRIRYRKAVFGPAQDLIAAVHANGARVDVWNATSGERVTTLDNAGARGPDVDLAVSPDGRWLAAAGQGPQVQIWDTRDWTHVVPLAAADVPSLAFDPVRPRIATVSRAGVAAIWDVVDGRRLVTLQDAGEPMDHVVYSPDGAWIANASRDGIVRVWDATSGSLAARLRDHHGKVLWVEFDATSTWIASGGADGVVTVSDRATGARVATFERARGEIKMVRFAPGAKELIAASVDGIAHVWPVHDSHRRFSAPPLGAGCGTDVVPREDGRFLAVSCETGAQVWDTANDRLLATLPGPQPLPPIPDPYPAVTSLGDRAAIALGNAVTVFALPGGAPLQTIDHPALVRTLAFAPGGHDLVTASADGTLFVVRDGQAPVAVSVPGGAITAVGFTPEGHAIVATANDHRIRVYDLARGQVRYELDGSLQPAEVRALRVSPDGHRLVTLVMDTTTVVPVLWDLPNRRRIGPLSTGKEVVLAARFLDNRRIVTTSRDGIARLWNAETGALQQAFLGSSVVVFDAALDPAGAILATAAGDGAIRFWDMASGRLVWVLHAHRSFVNGVHVSGTDLVSRGYDGDLARWALPSLPVASSSAFARIVRCLPRQLDEKTGALVDGTPCPLEAR